ncbi:MAG: phosphoribosylamine--glycine ligase [Bacteroidota bacterium]
MSPSPPPDLPPSSKVLLVGGGGREHALAWKLAQSPRCREIVVAPGNPGIARLPRVRVAAVKVDDTAALLALARAEAVDLIVCGPEGPLSAGLGDAARAAGFPFFGPSRAAAEIESSKAFAKRMMAEAGVPTAAFGVFDDAAAAERFIDAQPGPVVVKADGLCAGKGVVVASTKDESKAAVRRMIGNGVGDGEFGTAGARVVLEERLFGREVSMMALCDGERLALLPTAEDHKAVFDGDEGPNTGGMGTYSPSPLVGPALADDIVARIFAPTVRAMRSLGRPFSGLLYGGLMLTPDRGPMVIEWNCRLGDPETQVVLVRTADDLLPWLWGAATGHLPSGALRETPDAAVCVVLAAAHYPGTPRTGDAIAGLPAAGIETADGVLVFQAGTRGEGGRVLTAGGRVLGITARGADLRQARARAYGAIGTDPGAIHFAGMHFRADIGTRGEK